MDLVRALSLSVGVVWLEGEGEPQRSCAALSGVWNGSKGYVVLLVRGLDQPKLQRFSYSEPLLTPESVLVAVEEGMGFAESMGFVMEPHQFMGLTSQAQQQRLHAWDDLRKLDRTPAVANESSSPSLRGRQRLARVPLVSLSSERAGPQSRLRAQF
jgi:hypothetical protein